MAVSRGLQGSQPSSRTAADGDIRRETAQYISEMTLELRNLAKAHDMSALQGLLEVAYYEAFTVAAQIELPEGELEHLRELGKASNN